MKKNETSVKVMAEPCAQAAALYQRTPLSEVKHYTDAASEQITIINS